MFKTIQNLEIFKIKQSPQSTHTVEIKNSQGCPNDIKSKYNKPYTQHSPDAK